MHTWVSRLGLFLVACFLFSDVIFAAPEQRLAPDSTFHFLNLTDIHFDPFVSCENKTPCPLIQQLQHAPSEQWEMILASNDKSSPRYRQDTNNPLLISALTTAKKTAALYGIQFVLLPGDLLGHEYRTYYMKYAKDATRAGYQSFVRKTYAFLIGELAKTFPTTDVYAAVGNNDSYQGDYISKPSGAFFRENAVLWSQLIKNKTNRAAMQKQFTANGYYAVDLTKPDNLRLIVLNTNLFSANARGANIDAAANEELDWLHNQLKLATEKHQQVMIAMHIPTGIDVYASIRIRLFTLVELWKTAYTMRFQMELQQFAPTIVAIFAAHLHSDWFQILTYGKDEIPVIGTPSVSPIFGNNPGFKIFTYSPALHQLTNYITYYFPLHSNAVWRKEYDFARIYQPQCQPHCSILHGMSLLHETGLLANYYKYFYAVSTESQPITTEWYPYYWCAIRKIDAQSYKSCLG